MIDFELYRIFVAVATEGNITKASDKFNISQPAITKHIKNLENQLSMILVESKVIRKIKKSHRKTQSNRCTGWKKQSH